jgi:Ni,Fe-hydrogenase III large subunit/Ni,Fe-hydrogenase III component G
MTMETQRRDDRRTNVFANLLCSRMRVDREQWLRTAEELCESGARLLTLWGTDDRDHGRGFRIDAAYLLSDSVCVVEHRMADETEPWYPSLANLFPAALRMQRAVYDLLGISTDESDDRGWLRHGGWPQTVFPMRRDVDASQQYPVASQAYPFVSVEGDGVHEISVGPVHAGTIEPGNFRFSVVGEKVLRLEERLGYTHKGVAKLFESLTQQSGHRLAARVSGDSAVAFSWAYCAALEAITATACSARAFALRGLALEHERLANHLGDLGALGNDAGFAFGLTHFSKLKEDLLRANNVAFGERYLMEYVVPGGVAVDMSAEARGLLLELYDALASSVIHLRAIYDNHAGLQDRFREAGRLDRSTAKRLGAIGLAGRASGLACDLRVDHPWAPYTSLEVSMMTQKGGDVAARVQIRFDEVMESLRLCRALLADDPAGAIQITVPTAPADQLGMGIIEGWRGPVVVALETGSDGGIHRCHVHDPSWQNWPLIEHAVIGDIVPDFPLINKSFNLSYSGQDG